MTHARFACEKPRSRCIDGSATFTIVASSTIISWPMQTTASVTHRRRSPLIRLLIVIIPSA